jgi:outer membrane protein OmpA-like peptidoglycan-associated protein
MKSHYVLFFLMAFASAGLAQSPKALSDAERYFGIRNYEEALPLFLQAIESGVKEPMVYYKTGVCLANSVLTDKQLEAIPYFEYALKNGATVPVSVHYDLGNLYLRAEDLQKAMQAFTTFKESSNKSDKKAMTMADRALEQCNNAVVFMSVPRSTGVTRMSNVINSQYTEYNPVVSADESVLAFTALRPNTGKTRSGDKFIEEIYISYNHSGTWSEPKVVPVASDFNVGTAGISPDGQRMLIFMGGVSDPGSIFVIERTGENWSKPSLVANTLNTPKYLESTASITPDGKTIYFASDRVGGRGGLDIYRIDKKSDGTWTAPVNLGPEVNTPANEDAPFIHPDQQTLFFTSDGPGSMGGRDIFKTMLVNGKWTRPENMGYPVNTTANDNYFTLIADGTRGYFSSDRKGGQGAQDIYYIDMPDESRNIPLTMLKGKILNADTGKPLPTTIYVIDNETNKRLDFVYNPDPETGNYLVILPPAKNYDIIVESEGFLPYTLNIHIPNQSYFYELFQQISLKTIKQFDVVVGQEVSVKNAFYDTNQDVKASLRKTHEAKLVQDGNVDVYDMMIDLMAAGDQEGIDYLVELIQMQNSIDNINFNEEENSRLQVATRTYYYDESDESKFERKVVQGKEIFSLPTFHVTEAASKAKEKPEAPAYDKALLNTFVKVYFDAGKSELKPQYQPELDKVLEILKNNPGLGVEISGFASAEGSEEFNREISNKRAITVLDYINQRGRIVRRRIVAKGYGATDEAPTKEEGRRVEVRIVDLASR